MSNPLNTPEKSGAITPEPPVDSVKILTPAAERALAEAEARRKEQAKKELLLANEREYAGRGGKDPVRYNDWEVKGIASDF